MTHFPLENDSAKIRRKREGKKDACVVQAAACSPPFLYACFALDPCERVVPVWSPAGIGPLLLVPRFPSAYFRR